MVCGDGVTKDRTVKIREFCFFIFPIVTETEGSGFLQDSHSWLALVYISVK